METITSVSILTKLVETQFNSGSYLFRGQSEDWPLKPKIGRGTLKDDFLAQEQNLLEEFRLRSRPHLVTPERNPWDLLAIAQHHGMSTRLLDWSQNALAALWFAVKDDPKEGDHGVVWGLPVTQSDVARPDEETPFDGNRTKVFRPSHVTKSIVAQSGWFTVHKFIRKEKRFVPLEKNKLYKRQCAKLVVPHSHFLLLRHQLDQLGVNHSTMFPDLNGLGDYLNFTHGPRFAVMRFPRTGNPSNQKDD